MESNINLKKPNRATGIKADPDGGLLFFDQWIKTGDLIYTPELPGLHKVLLAKTYCDMNLVRFEGWEKVKLGTDFFILQRFVAEL